MLQVAPAVQQRLETSHQLYGTHGPENAQKDAGDPPEMPCATCGTGYTETICGKTEGQRPETRRGVVRRKHERIKDVS